jgi:hypothetical protein
LDLKPFGNCCLIDALLQLILDRLVIGDVDFCAASVDTNSSLVMTNGLQVWRFLRAGRDGYLPRLVQRYVASLRDLAPCRWPYAFLA